MGWILGQMNIIVQGILLVAFSRTLLRLLLSVARWKVEYVSADIEEIRKVLSLPEEEFVRRQVRYFGQPSFCLQRFPPFHPVSPSSWWRLASCSLPPTRDRPGHEIARRSAGRALIFGSGAAAL